MLLACIPGPVSILPRLVVGSCFYKCPRPTAKNFPRSRPEASSGSRMVMVPQLLRKVPQNVGCTSTGQLPSRLVGPLGTLVQNHYSVLGSESHRATYVTPNQSGLIPRQFDPLPSMHATPRVHWFFCKECS